MLAGFTKAVRGLGVMLALVGLPTVSQAQLDLGHPSIAPFFGNNIGNNVDRSVAFGAVANYSITSAGIRLDPLTVSSFTLRATLRSASTGP